MVAWFVNSEEDRATLAYPSGAVMEFGNEAKAEEYAESVEVFNGGNWFVQEWPFNRRAILSSITPNMVELVVTVH